jgi:hypothetical protein
LSNVEYNRAILLEKEKKRRTSGISNLYNSVSLDSAIRAVSTTTIGIEYGVTN